MYFADSPTHQIRIYDFDAPTAGLSNQRVFATIDTHINPDGSTVDAGGYLWNAQWGGGRIVRYTSAGAVDRIIETPCSQPTCVTFGGRDMRYLFVSSARDGLSREALLAQPEAGNLFIYETPFTGIADRQFVQS
jgi:sugar lactone lactonase YvrE